MATDFIMPRLPDQQPHQFYNGFQQPPQAQYQPPSPPYPPSQQPFPTQPSSQQISPLSTSNSNNPSPTSPRGYHGQRLRPMYMPAVLRPTEHPSKCSVRKSEDQQQDGSCTIIRTNSSFISLSGLGALGRTLSRRSTGDSGKCMDGEWNFDLFPKPTAQPTREHWKADIESAICDEPSCLRHFNYWTRRHHCRRCGNIFCDFHSAFDIPLDQDANYNPKGTISRACEHCYSEFKAWRSRTNSTDSTVVGIPATAAMGAGSHTAPTSPLATSHATMAIGASATKPQTREVAASVPRDWNWSTF